MTQNSTADILSSQWPSVPAGMPRLRPTGVAHHSPEFELLCACCGDKKGISPSLGQELRWDQVFQQASYHRVLPALYTVLQSRPEVPASIQSALRAKYLTHCQRVVRFSAELVGILQHFEGRAIPVIAQKGPALASLLYGDSTMREFGDLDLLVRPTDVPRAIDVLTELGYEKSLQLSPRQEKSYLQSGYEYVFGLGAERNLIELQWNLAPKFYSVDVGIDALFDRSQVHEFDGCTARVLGPEDQLMFLCLHATKHQWAQLGMIRDIAAVAGLDLDWDLIVGEARELGVLRFLVMSLLLANELMGCKLPTPMSTLADRKARKFVAGVIEEMRSMREIPAESSAYFRLMLQLRERRWDQAKFIWRLATTPSVSEWKAMRIPDALFRLYSVVRFLRLFRRIAS